ncbi:MAG: pilus assembly PilX N-terminal domain-containing protein [Gammaproteobacteria bacterium]|nr:pilus assembly PilX N-terminal domain-containing protein [Gammaproteobacteria bacterium]
MKPLNAIQKQSGSVTLVMTAIILFLLSMVSVFAARIITTDYRINANHYRAKQLFDAAQAGIDQAISTLDRQAINANIGSTDIFSGGPHTLCPQIQAGQTEFYCATDASGTIGLAVLRAQYNPVLVGDTSQLTLTINAFSPNANIAGGITANKTFTQIVQFSPLIPNPPPGPLTVLGDINAAGVRLTNTNTDIAAWSGGAAVAPPNTFVKTGTGIYPSDTNLAALGIDPAQGMFDNFVGFNKAIVRRHARTINCTGGCTDTNADIQKIATSTGGTYWLAGDLVLNSNTVLGTSQNPIVLIMEGNLTLSKKNDTINGLVYKIGDWIDTGSKGTINGALIVEGSFTETGNMDVWYGDLLLGTPQISNLNMVGMYTSVAGSWRDFF